MSDLDVTVTFSHKDDPAFCPEEKGENPDGEDRVDENAEDDGYEDDPNESILNDLTLGCHPMLGPPT